MKNQKRYLIVVISFLLTVCFQRTSFSQVNISGIVNQYSAVTAITQPACSPCDVACIHTITVTDGSLFQPGDKALIIQMKGATINTANTAGSGDVTAINDAGNYEFFVVGSVVGNLLTPAYPLIRNYTVSGKVQVVRIPQFADNVNITGTLTAQDWDEVSGTGGVVAIEAKKVTFNAGIDVLGQGYKGIQMLVNGTPDNCTPGPTTLFNVSSATNSSYTKGDGIVLDNTATNRGRAPRANGGGSGISGDSGGGGGSNYGAGGEGGKRWCDIDGANAGGIGGFAMTTYLAQNKVFLGGAGGPGFVTTNNPSNAANGGGIVIIFADTIVGNGNTINARGTSPVAINPVGAPDGGGGGGAGGSVVLKTETFVGNITVNVSGGDGQDLNTTTPHGPGGGGGGGVLLYSLAALPAGLTLNNAGGIGGEHLAGASSIRNGSQDGSAGGSISLYVPIQNPNYQGNIDNDVIPVSCDIDDDNDGVPDVVEAYSGDHDSDGTLDYMDADFCGATFQGINGWDCATMGLPDPSGDMDGDLIPNYMDANFPTCGGLLSGGICANFDADGDGNPVHLDLDSDNDGIPDLIEAGGVDTNGDGQIDTAADLDGDGLANLYDNNDTDGPTGTSPCAPSPNCLLNTSTSLLLDTDANGSNDFTADFDNDGFPNFTDLDSDNDGITDVIEANGIDANNDGIADSFVDIDNDGFNDVVDGEFINCTTTGSYIYTPASPAYATANGPGDVSVTNPANALGQPLAADFALLNSTGDIATLQIANTINTGGTINLYISNPSGNTANTNVLFSSNGTVFSNTTASNIPAANTAMTMYSFVVPINTVAIRVVRTDNDDINLHGLDYTIPASILNTLSTSCITSNGTPLITTGADSDADGNPNSYVSGNSDADLQCNFIDIDSDNDGIVDNSEAQSTTVYIAPTGLDNDNDGIDNAYDANDGGTAIIPVNTDGTDNTDYLDLDSDNDGLTDAIEGWDTDGNGITNTLPIGTDVDNDGLDDAYDVNDALVNPTNGTTPTSYPNVSISGTPERDWREVNPPTVTLTGTTSIAENTAGVATLTATLSSVAATDVFVTIGYTGTAVNGTDYTPSSVTITIPAGSTTGTVTIDPTDDVLFEGSETVIADITNVTGGNGASESGTQQATVTITDDEVAPTVTLSGTTSIVEDAAGVATLTATLSVATTTSTTVTVTYTGTAVGADYVASSVTITIPAGSTTGTVTVDPTDDVISEGSETVIADITNVTGGNGATESGTQTATVTITDNDVPTVTLSGTTSIAEDAAGVATLTATLSNISTTATIVTLTYSGTAVGADYAASSVTITIPAGSTTGTVTIDPTDDAISEGNETVIADITSVTGGNGATESGTQTATVTITDNDAPTVTLSGTTSIAENAAGVVTLTATLSNAATTDVTVTIGYTGTAVGADYAASSVTITIPAGSTTGTVTVDPTDDALVEGSETVIADITNVTGGNGATESGTQTATVTITDNDAPTVTLSGTTSIAEDAAGVATLTATLSAVAPTPTVVTVTYTGTAVGADYAASSVTITIPAGSTTGTVTIDPTDDLISEGSETVIADITSVTGGNGATESGTQTATVTITDNDAPTVTLSGTTSIAEDAAGVATLTATLSNVATTDVTITIGYTGTATGADYTASSVTITIPAGSTTGTVTIDPTDDAISEGNETVIADITNVTGGNGATESGTQTATVTITDNDAPTVTLSGTTSIAENAAGVATLTATLSNVSTTATVVTFTYTGTAVGADYAASSVTITIPAGSTTGTVTVDPTDDALVEGSETVIADITNVTGGNGATESGTQQATVTITDDDTPTVTLSGTTSIAEDAAGVATLTATLSAVAPTPTIVTVTYTGTAVGADYAASSVTITIPAGSTTGTVTVDPTDDLISEGSETVIADITNVTGGNGATESGTQTATVTIIDNDAPTVTLSGTTSIAEDAAGVATLTATLSNMSTTATVVTVAYTGTAVGVDYAASSVTITIPAGSTTGTVTVDPTDDVISEGSETVIADITSVTGGNGATESGTQTATVTITDNDAPTVTLSGTTSIAEDAAGVATLTATLSNVSTTATVVTLTYSGTAVGADYAASSVTITIPAGSTTGTVTVDPTDDVISEGSETVIADITNVTGGNGATESGTQTATVTITDNDAPTVTLSGTTSIAENAAGVATLTATLSNVSTTATVVTVAYTGTAVGADYAASSVTITIPAGSTTGTVTVDPTDDVISEGSETVIVDITNVTGGNGATESGTQTATVTITDNDAPTVTLSGTTSIAEDAAGVVTLTATLSNVATTDVTVTIGYTGTAVGADYAASSVTITIPAGSTTGTVTVDPTDDLISEGSETVIADITAVTGGNGATESGTQTATVTITDNDAPTVTLSGTTSIAENAAGVATLTATLSNVSTTATVVTLTYSGTAVGADYAASSVTITIPAGSTTGTVTIDPTDDALIEGSETVIADITNVTGGNGATESGTQQATVTITDDDTPTVTLSGTTSIAEDAAGVATLTATLSAVAPTPTVVTVTYTGTAVGADYAASSVTITIPAGSTTGTVTIDPTDDVISEGSETVIADITNVTGGNGATESGTQTATVTITDNDAPTVTLSGTTSIAEDAAGVATLTATLSNVSTTATVVTVAYTGTAVGADYAASSVTITIPSGSTTGTVTVDPTDDIISEGSETVIADITNVTGGNGATESGTQTATVTITDNDAPTVTLSGTTSIAENAAGVATLTATLSNVSTTATVVTLTYSGTAVGADYAASSVTITIPAGSLTGTVTIDPTDDVISEGSETVIADITSVTGGNGATESGTQTATVTITDNDAPTVTLSGTTSIAEDAAGVATLTATLSNVSTTATVVTLTYSGTAVGADYAASSVTITIPAGSTTGTVTVDPTVDAVYEGSETVIADITNVTGGNGATESGTQQAIVTIIDVNVPPVAVDNSATTNEDQAVTLSAIQTNDTDSDGSVIVGTIDLDPTQAGQQTTFTDAQGTWVLNTTTGDVVFTPAPNFNGTATIQYTIADNAGATSNSANLTVTVNPVNDAPVVDNDVLVTNEDTPASGDVTDSGDNDPDGTPLTVNTIPVDGPNNGTIVVNTDGTYTYTPNTNYNGLDTVIVSVCDAGTPGISCVNDTIFITVNPVNDAPIVDNEIITTNEDTPVSGDLTDAGDSDPDGTPLTVNTTPVDGPNNGTIVVNSDGTYTYTPNTNYNGLDTVIVSVCDAGTPGISCVNDTIFITVNPVNDSPIVDNENITTNEDTPVSGDLTDAGDSDPDGTPLTVNTTPVDGPNNGTIVVNADGTFTYTPNPNYNGLDTIVVSVCDAGAPGIICINDTIFVTVNPVNDAPIVDNEIITTNEDTPVSGDLTNAGDSDVDGNLVVTTTPVDGPNNGTILINPDGSFTYNPNPNYVGQDTIVVQICDDGTPTPVICVNDTIFITINPCSASDLLADCDQDGVTNGDEIDPDGDGTPGPNGTDPLNPCSFNLADQDFALVSATWLASDCDGDGVTNGEEVDPDGDGTPGPNGTNPSNPCDYDGTLQDFASVSATWLSADCDGDGVTNGEEVDPDGDGTPGPNGTNPNDPCEFDLVTQDFTTVSSSWLAADCDGDGVTNGDEVDPDGDGTPGPNGTDINNPCDFASANATVAPSTAWLAADCDGDGVTNGEEIDPDGDGTPGPNGTNPNDPCEFDSALQDFATVSVTWLSADCDGDGVTNGEEVDPDGDGTPGPNGTNPSNPCDYDGTLQDFTVVSSTWLAADCDGDGVTNGDEVDPDGDGTPGPNGTNPSDPCDFDLVTQDFATVSSAWLAADCDGDGVTNGDEVDPDGDGTPGPNGTDINNPCDFDFANATVAPSSSWLAADCDGDGVTNGEEVDPDGDGTPGPNGTNPNDPCEYDASAQDFTTVSTAWLGSDCDGDGVTNGDEVDPDGDGTPGPNGTNPNDPCDFLLSDTTVAPSAAWLAADCDGDGVTNGDEITGGSDPLNACSPKPCDLFIPQAFTPDGDGVNDNFVIEGIELFPDNEIVILNRWGNVVFQATNYQNDWNGTSNSSLNIGNGDLPTGTYYYILDPKKEGYEVYKGYIYLQR